MLYFLRYVLIYHPIYAAIPSSLAFLLLKKPNHAINPIIVGFLILAWIWVLPGMPWFKRFMPWKQAATHEHYARLRSLAPERPAQRRVRQISGALGLTMLLTALAMFTRGRNDEGMIAVAAWLACSLVVLEQEYRRFRTIETRGA